MASRTLLLLLLVWSLALAAAVSCTAVTAGRELGRRGVMPWLCLERCGNTTATDVMANIEQLVVHRDVIAGVSFEHFNLGPNSTLVLDTTLTNAAPLLRAQGFTTVAMVSSYPYPKDFIVWMRQVFATPEPFFEALIAHMRQWQIDGVNIDWEPVTGVELQDAADYADFLGKLRVRLDAAGFFISVDVATWSPIWNLTLINQAVTSVKGTFAGVRPGFVATMNTYALPDAEFEYELKADAGQLNHTQWLVGVETWPGKLVTANVSLRFDAVARLGLDRVAIWRSPVPDFWWPVIAQWFSS